MRFLRNYSYPFFLTVSGTAATVSDVLQNPIAAYILMAALLVTAGVVFLGGYVNWIDRVVEEVLPDNLRLSFSRMPFAASCLILALMLGAFTTLSAKAADEGGLIASNYPEVRALQLRLGVVQRSVDRIERKTDQILDATRQWLSITDFRVWQPLKDVHIRIENLTPFLFTSIAGKISDNANVDIEFGGYALAADNIHWENFAHTGSAPERMIVCLSAKRASDGIWIGETRTYVRGKEDNVSINYMLESVDGPKQLDAKGCEG